MMSKNSKKKKMKEKIELTIGCDPEYGIIKGGRLITPSDIISNSVNEFGIDGSGRVAELRPPHSTTPHGLTMNIAKVLIEGVSRHSAILDYKMKAGGTAVDEPIGGHIHFGHPQLKKPEKARIVGQALDKTLAVLVLMVEDQEEALNRRIGSSYGNIGNGNYRDQPWGMEYRVLPSWLTSPEECEAVLSLSYIIASEHEDEDLMDEACSLPAYDSQAFKECDKVALMYWIPDIIGFIKKLPKYEEYREKMLPLFKLIKNQKVWSCEKNMLDTWNLQHAYKELQKKEKMLV